MFMEPVLHPEIDNDVAELRREVEILNAELARSEARLEGREREANTQRNRIAGLEHALARARFIEESAKTKTKEVKAAKHEMLQELRATRADLDVALARIDELEKI